MMKSRGIERGNVFSTFNPVTFNVQLKNVLFYDLEHPRKVEPETDFALEPVAVLIGEPGAFGHANGIGKVQLEYVATCFDVEPNGKRIAVEVGRKTVDDVRIVPDERHPAGEFDPAAKTYGIQLVGM